MKLQNKRYTTRERNAQSHLTGFLLFRSDVFIQVLEGEREKVSRLLSAISQDPRHSDVVIVGCKLIDRRRFGDWEMGYYALKNTNRAKLLQYSVSPDFDPGSMCHDTLVDFVADAAASRSGEPTAVEH